jgi:hypothetical protein
VRNRMKRKVHIDSAQGTISTGVNISGLRKINIPQPLLTLEPKFEHVESLRLKCVLGYRIVVPSY